MKVSVVVPAFNEERLLAGSLAAIRDAMRAFDQDGGMSELIVCDNNSTDRTAEIARAAGATVVFEPVNQIARARNRGAAAASGDWLVFVDADSYPSKGLFEDAREVGGAVGGVVVADDQFERKRRRRADRLQGAAEKPRLVERRNDDRDHALGATETPLTPWLSTALATTPSALIASTKSRT